MLSTSHWAGIFVDVTGSGDEVEHLASLTYYWQAMLSNYVWNLSVSAGFPELRQSIGIVRVKSMVMV